MGAKEDSKVYKYAQQFVDAVGHRSDVWSIYDEVASFITIIEETGLRRFLIDATVSVADKENFLRSLRKSDYRAFNDMIEAMIQQEDFSLIKDVLQVSLKLISKQKNEFDVSISTYQPLNEGQRNRIQALVERKFDIKTRHIVEEIDKSLVGGFIVTVNHQVIDASVRKQLSDIRKKL